MIASNSCVPPEWCNDSMPFPGPGFPHLAFHIDRDRFESVIGLLRGREVQFLGEPTARDDFGVPVRAAFVLDPVGNTIELTGVGPLRT